MSLKNLAFDVESIALALSEEGGYEYYHIDDELRELAKDVSDMQAENARLREQVDAAHMSRLLTENENESLRELITSVHEALCLDKAGVFHKPIIKSLERDMRELGMEVES